MADAPSTSDASSDSPPTRDEHSGLLDPGGDRSFLLDALIGAGVAIVLSFVPFSPVLGGAAAAYLHREDGPQVGAASGVVAALPTALFGFVAFVFLGFGPLFLGGDAAGSVLVLVLLLFALVFFAVINAVLGAVGGFLGIKLAKEYPDPPW